MQTCASYQTLEIDSALTILKKNSAFFPQDDQFSLRVEIKSANVLQHFSAHIIV